MVWASYAIVDPAVLRQLPLLVPRPYLGGVAYLASHDTMPAAGYIAGLAYTGGRWWFWPLSLVISGLLLACFCSSPGPSRAAGSPRPCAGEPFSWWRSPPSC